MPEQRIKNATSLLDDIAKGLKKFQKTDLGCIEVVFYQGKRKKPVGQFDVCTALDYLANDVYYDTEGDWSEADRAEVRSI
jgi:hypothetical protein